MQNDRRVDVIARGGDLRCLLDPSAPHPLLRRVHLALVEASRQRSYCWEYGLWSQKSELTEHAISPCQSKTGYFSLEIYFSVPR